MEHEHLEDVVTLIYSCNPPGPDHASHSHTHLIITVQYFTLHSHTHLIIIRLRTLLVEMQVKIDN